VLELRLLGLVVTWLGGPRVEQAAAGLEKIVAECLRHAAPAEVPLLAWPLVCGSAVAGRTRALSFTAGVLRVAVADASWKSELQTLAARYLAGVNRYSAQTVHKIEFVITSPEVADKPPC